METTINKINKYTHTSSDEFDGYEETLTGVLRLHKDKLDAYLKAPEMNKLIKIKLENTFAGKYKDDGKRMYSDTQIERIIDARPTRR